MKPRTKLQHEVAKYSKYLPPIGKDINEWAFKECLEHKGFATKTRVVCMDCGETFSPDLVYRKRAICPHCGTKIKIENTRKTTDHQYNIFATAEVWVDFQVIRHFEINARYKKGQDADYFTYEILQYWIDGKGKVTMIGRNHNTQGYCDSWGGDWSIRVNRRSGWYYNGNKYKIYPYKYHPDSVFKPEYKKYGIDHRLDGLYILDALEVVPKNPHAETLLKARQYSLLFQCRDYSGNINYHWPSIKICLRNRYRVKDASLWFDYLDLLRYFNKDIRNAHYVCPKNLKREHDRLLKKKQLIRAAEERALKRKRAIKEQKDYIREKQKFFGLQFSKGNITIKVLEHVNEFVEESTKLKHCLFDNEYHKKQNSLILKAEINGISVETIEVCLKSFTILQSRGKHNNPTKYHNEIIELMNKNISKIKNIAKRKQYIRKNRILQMAG